MKRIALLAFQLESNRFAPVTERGQFDKRCWLEGAEVLSDARLDAPRQGAEIPAFIEEISTHLDVELVPILAVGAEPGGPLSQSAMEEIFAVVREGLRQAGSLDGVFVASHGAMVGTQTDDPDGAFLALLRTCVGPNVPIVATLDLHANLSEQMAQAANCLIGYRTNPHVDQANVAREAARVMARMLSGTPVHMAHLRLPLTPASVTLLTESNLPYAAAVLEAARLTDPDGDILNATVLGGFVYSDTPDNGVAVVVTAVERDQAEREASRLAGTLWAARHRFTHRLTSIEEAVATITSGVRPLQILADSGDNPGGGGRGTSTDLLRALIAAQAQSVLYGLFVDPSLAQEAALAGVGAKLNARFLRHGADEFGEPFAATAEVIALSDGRVTGRRGLVAGRQVDLGTTVALQIGGVTVVVSSNRKQCADPVYFEHLGLDPGAFHAVVVKSRGHFRAGFDETFGPDQVLEVDTRGLTSPVLSNFTFRGLPRPVYPLDPEATWIPPDWARPHLDALGLMP